MTTLRDKRAAYALQLIETKQFGKAVSLYNRMVADDPADVDVLRRLAELHLHLDQAGKALSALERIAEHFYRLGRTLEAAAAYEHIWNIIARRAPALRSRFPHLSARLCELHGADANADRALGALERLLGTHHELAIARLAAQRYLDTHTRTGALAALTHLRRCFRNDFVDSGAASLAVRAFDQLGQPEKGTLLLKESARIAWRVGDDGVFNALVDALTVRSFDETVVEFETRRDMIRGEVTVVEKPGDTITNVDIPDFDADNATELSAELLVEDGADDGATPIPLQRRISESPAASWRDETTPNGGSGGRDAS